MMQSTIKTEAARRAAPGRRMLEIASYALIVVALLHTIGNLNTTPADAAEASLQAAMRAYRVPLGMGMVPSVWDIFRGLVFTMSVCVVAMGVLGIVVANPEVPPRIQYRTALVLLISCAGLTAMYGMLQIPPPFISFAVVTLLYAVCVVQSRGASAD
jgi:Fe2+ transport system protein B